MRANDNEGVNADVKAYVDAISPEHRPLFDRVHRLIIEEFPDAAVVLSYKMPTYKLGRRRLFVGAWQHGISMYGWTRGRDSGFLVRHPELKAAKGTIRLRPKDAEGVTDKELRELIRATLAADQA